MPIHCRSRPLREILRITGLEVELGKRRGLLRQQPGVRAVDGVDLVVHEGGILGIVGESGCGKTTLARTVLGLQREAAGKITFFGDVVSGVPASHARRMRHAIQYVHQDPGAALDPWWRLGASLAEGLSIHGVTDRTEQKARIAEIMEAVGLDMAMTERYPHELSGGQQRRMGLARILLLRPKIVILDEPTAGLDLSVQASVLRLLYDLRDRFGLTYVFISHDLSVVRRVCDRIAVMYLGKIVEEGNVGDIFAAPRHPYTRALMAAAPHLDGVQKGPMLQGDPPSLRNVPSGCRFHPRCAIAQSRCRTEEPSVDSISDNKRIACHYWQEGISANHRSEDEAYATL